MNARYYFIFYGLALLILSGCGTQPATPPQVYPDTQQREKLAVKYLKQNMLTDALIQWRILNAIYPNNTMYVEQISKTQKKISAKTKKLLTYAREQNRLGNYRQAKTAYLKVLALNPLNPTPLAYLREMSRKNVTRYQELKLAKLKEKQHAEASTLSEVNHFSEQEREYLLLGIALYEKGDYQGSIQEIEKYLSSYPEDKAARQYIADAYLKIGKKAESEGNLEYALKNFNNSLEHSVSNNKLAKHIQTLNTSLANKYYELGARAYTKNIDEAIKYWQTSLSYNATHTKSKLRLNRALKIRTNLQQLEN